VSHKFFSTNKTQLRGGDCSILTRNTEHYIKNSGSLFEDTGTARAVWLWLRSLSPDVVKREGRVYGGGLHKVEPRELGNVPADQLFEFLGMTNVGKEPIQLSLLSDAHAPPNTIER
jgi:hypothetical protein